MPQQFGGCSKNTFAEDCRGSSHIFFKSTGATTYCPYGYNVLLHNVSGVFSLQIKLLYPFIAVIFLTETEV